MQKSIFILLLFLFINTHFSYSQCAVCKSTISKIDDKSAKGLNSGIIYLAAMPLIIMGLLGYKIWRQNKNQ